MAVVSIRLVVKCCVVVSSESLKGVFRFVLVVQALTLVVVCNCMTRLVTAVRFLKT